MKFYILAITGVFLFAANGIFAQSAEPTPTPKRERVYAPPTPQPEATPRKIIVVTNTAPAPTPTPFPTATPLRTPLPVYPNSTSTNYKSLSFAQLKAKIAEAKRQMQSRPLPTAMTDSFAVTDLVRIAFQDWNTNEIDYAVMSKSMFLSRGAELNTISSSGKPIRISIIRANGVNTPITIFNDKNQAQLPLVVQYPVEKNSVHTETAYYISTHPGLVTPEVIGAGKFYVHNTLELARENLRKKGIFIQPQVADVAEHLAIVEHIDHSRYFNEYQPNLFNEVYALFALNEGGTYRYSVSSAGAGGMVQMIPATYRMIRSRYFQVGLMPDFLEGMRDHQNAAQAMLLYMQMTWNDLIASETIFDALQNGVATQAELLSAGYNSNPAKLPQYINRGGAGWKTLIPRETKIYLQIYDSMERNAPLTARTK